MELIQMLDEIKKKKQIDNQSLAYLLNVNKSQITRWYNGSLPKLENLRRVKKVYDELSSNCRQA